MNNRFPQAYLIGAVKSGTTTLHKFFRHHSQTYTPELKYLRYFVRELHESYKLGLDEEIHKERYLRNFEAAGSRQVTVDCDVLMLESPRAAERISRVRPDAKIIAVLRNPVECAWAHYIMNFEHGLEDREPEEAFFGVAVTRPGVVVPERYLYSGLYHRHLLRFAEQFPRERILLIPYNRFRRNPWETQRDLEKFLCIEPEESWLGKIQENRTVYARSETVRWLLRWRYRLLSAPQPIPILGDRLRRLWHQLAFTEKITKRSIPDKLRKEMVDFYRDDATKLQQDFGIDTTMWFV